LDIPVIDVTPLVGGAGDRDATAAAIGRACRECGFFYVTGHGVDPALETRLFEQARRFFALPLEAKATIRMERGGAAWRGWFPVGAELTAGRPDWKEGIYFGAELSSDHPRVRAGTPLHGPNLFPDLPGFRETVLDWMAAMTQLGHALMRGLALSLELPSSWFADRYTADPLVLFRIFDYPSIPASDPEGWSVGEHTDYGVLTILLQDDAGGLQVKVRDAWIDAPPIAGAFVCNLGDMLDRMTGGLYRSTPHRVRNAAMRDRLSFPFFFDPAWDAAVRPIPGCEAALDDRDARWDRASVHDWSGTYGEYLLAKVSKVFPELGRDVLR
jgi:isopenicillin N synthase-like dioxygenase